MLGLHPNGVPPITVSRAATDDGAGQRRTTIASIVAAMVLMTLKLGTGLVTGSLGLVSAGIESSGDVVAAGVTLFARRLGARPADAEHPYGYRRAENLSALAEATILLAGGAIVVVEASARLAGGGSSLDARWYVFAVILAAIAVDLSRVVVSLRTARRNGSAALRSNAFHFAGDMAGSFAVLAGLIAVRAGFADGDAVAALIVATIIFAAAGRLIFENARVLMDTAPAAAQQSARDAIAALSPETELHRLRVRESAGRYFADVVVSVPPGRAVIEGHQPLIRSSARWSRRCPTATSLSTSNPGDVVLIYAIGCSRSHSASRWCSRRTTSRSSSTASESAFRCT